MSHECHCISKSLATLLFVQQAVKANNIVNIKANALLSGVPDYFVRNKISSGGDLSHYSSASLY